MRAEGLKVEAMFFFCAQVVTKHSTYKTRMWKGVCDLEIANVPGSPTASKIFWTLRSESNRSGHSSKML